MRAPPPLTPRFIAAAHRLNLQVHAFTFSEAEDLRRLLALVAQWAGAELELGEVYGYEEEQPSPLVPGLVVPVAYQFSAARRVPCQAGASSESCVELRMYSVVDPEVMSETVQRLFTRMGIAAETNPHEALETMSVEHELTVIAEPATLLPHHVEMVKYVEVHTKETPAEKGGVTTQEDRRVYRYTYAR